MVESRSPVLQGTLDVPEAGRAQLKAETENRERISGVIGRVLQPESGN